MGLGAGQMLPSHNCCKIDSAPQNYILLGSRGGPLGKVCFTHRDAHDLSEEEFKRVCLHI